MTGSPDSTPASPQKSEVNVAARVRNFLIAIVAITLSIALFLGFKTETPVNALTTLAEESTPLEVAMGNDRPTLIEFYANWCTSCQAMAKDMGELKQQYADQLNFVMLNVDNNKWLPELERYRVDGIPHFVFLDPKGKTISQTLGEVPRPVMQAKLEALIAGLPIPYSQAAGQVSAVEASVNPVKASQDDPRRHGSQVQPSVSDTP